MLVGTTNLNTTLNPTYVLTDVVETLLLDMRSEMKKRGYDLSSLTKVIQILADGKSLPPQNRDHALSGNYAGFRECHIAPDWLLIMKYQRIRCFCILRVQEAIAIYFESRPLFRGFFF